MLDGSAKFMWVLLYTVISCCVICSYGGAILRELNVVRYLR
jgi:hypothetical protein